MRIVHLKTGLFFLCLFFAAFGQAQNKKISGKVTSQDGTPLQGVSITVKGKNIGASTNTEGNFTMDVAEGDVLVFSSVGFNDTEFTVGAAATATIILTEAESSKLDEVVVVGYGTAKRSKVTSSVAKLDAKILESGVRSSPAQALAGTIPGLRVSTGSGPPGSLPSIILRGGTNYDGSGSPLILMDGQVRGSLSDINPEEIASIEVLKDAAATAIYGARASNGVILVTTKKGKSGTSAINVKAKRGNSYLNTPYNFLNAEDYIKWARMGVVQAIINGNLGGITGNTTLAAVGPRGTGNLYKDPVTGEILDGNYNSRAIWSLMRLDDTNRELLSQPGWKQMKDAVPTNPTTGNYDANGTYADLIYRDFNYGDYGLYKKATIQDYNIGMSGGNDKGTYFANLGLYDEDGLSLKTFYRRINFTLNGDYKIKEWVKSESSLQFARANWRDQSLQNGEGNFWGRMLSAPPTMRGTNTKGELLLGRDASDGNPIVNIDKYKRDNQTDKFTLSQAFRFDVMKGLYFRISGILFYDEEHNESFNKDFRSTSVMSYTNPNTGWNRDRSSSALFNRTIYQTYNAIANYQTSIFGKHNIDAMVGYEYYDAYNKGLSAGGRLAPTDDFADLGLTLNNAATQTRSTDSWHARDRIMSGFGRINYDWDGKYLASFTIRRDGVSRLVDDNQYGNFPAASVGWMVHKENFMTAVGDWLSYLKLRASWGKNGNIGIGTNDPIGRYEVQGSYDAQIPYNGVVGFQNTLANRKLVWEKTNTTEVGADMGFLQNRVNASVAYYNRVTDDKLAYIGLPVSSGWSQIRTNNGSMRNRGVEMDVNYKIIQGKDFTWQVSANAAWNKNTVLKLPFNGNDKNRQGGSQIYDPKTGQLIWVGGLQEGQEWGEIYGFVSDGIIRDAKDLADYNKIDLAAGEVQFGASAGRRVASQKLINDSSLVGFIATQLGDMKWKDINNDGYIDYKDRVSLGRTLPRWTGGFNTSVSWKGFSLFARLDFALGHIQQDFMQMWALGSFQGEFNATDIVKDTWTPQNPNAKYPRYTWADQLNTKNFDRPSSMFLVNSNYLAFREVSLSYSLPATLLKKAGISDLTFTATGQNLGYITNELINLPERTGNQTSAYIIPTQVIFGVNLTF